MFWVGYIAWQRGDLQQARERMEEYLDHAERLVELEPGRPEWRTELGYAVSSLGSIDFERRDWASALESFTRSRGINLETVANHPDDEQARLDLGQDYSYIGETLSVLGRYTEAIGQLENLERSGQPFAVLISWKQAVPAANPTEYYPDALISSRTGGEDLALAYHQGSSNIFAMVVWDEGWSLHMSTDLGATWNLRCAPCLCRHWGRNPAKWSRHHQLSRTDL